MSDDKHLIQKTILGNFHRSQAGNLQTRLPERMRDYFNELARHQYPSREAMLSIAINEYLATHPIKPLTGDAEHPAIWQARAVGMYTGWVQYTVTVADELGVKVRDYARDANSSAASVLATALNWWGRQPEQAKYFKKDSK